MSVVNSIIGQKAAQAAPVSAPARERIFSAEKDANRFAVMIASMKSTDTAISTAVEAARKSSLNPYQTQQWLLLRT